MLFCTAAEGTTGTEDTEGGNLPKDNKTMRKSGGNSNKSSSAHYERSKDNPNMQNIPDAPSFNDYGNLLVHSLGGSENYDLAEARLKTLAGGFPIIGPFIQAMDKANMLEDLYNNTGKVPAYASISGVGYGDFGRMAGNAIGSLGSKIASGAHDLYQFYTGEPDAFRGMMNNAYM